MSPFVFPADAFRHFHTSSDAHSADQWFGYWSVPICF